MLDLARYVDLVQSVQRAAKCKAGWRGVTKAYPVTAARATVVRLFGCQRVIVKRRKSKRNDDGDVAGYCSGSKRSIYLSGLFAF